MINTFEQFLNEAKQKPVYPSYTGSSEKAGSVFVDMCNGINKKEHQKVSTAVLRNLPDEVVMYGSGGQPIMVAMKSSIGANVEFRFMNSTAVDRCNGWNRWQGREFTVIYSNGKPYAVVGSDYDNPETLTHFELSKTAWYSEEDLVNICKM